MSLKQSFVPFVISLSMLALVSGCDIILGQALIGSGVSMTENRDTEPFDGLKVSGAIKATVILGEPQSIEITGDDNIVPLVVTEVRDGTLRIKTEHNGSIRMKEQILVTIVTPELEMVDASGATHVTVEGISTNKFTADLSGASQVEVNGECEQLVADLSGASNLRAASLVAASAKVNASGASDARIHATESVVAEASGASDVKYSGGPRDVQADASGASDVEPVDE